MNRYILSRRGLLARATDRSSHRMDRPIPGFDRREPYLYHPNCINDTQQHSYLTHTHASFFFLLNPMVSLLRLDF